MSNSAINTQVAQQKIGNVQNQADTSAVYNAGNWSFKDATAVTRFYVSNSGDVGIGTTSPGATCHVKKSVDGTVWKIEGPTANLIYQEFTNATYLWNQGSNLLFGTNSNHALSFGTNNAGRMTISSAGNITLGATGFTGEHTVKGSLIAESQFQGTVTNISNFADGALLVRGNGISGKAFMGLSTIGGGGGCGFVFTRGGSYDTFVQVYTSTSGAGAGGALNSAGPFVGNGGLTWSAGSSDVRLKKNFETTQGLAEILQIEPVKYHMNEDEDSAPKRLGFKAQNIQPLIPEMVIPNGKKAEDGSDYLTVTPDYLLPVLVKAIQELSAKVDAQAAEIKALKAQP